MSNPWLKLWTEIIRDTKLRRLPAAERWCWIGVLCLAGECGQEGRLEIGGDPLSDAEIADACGVDVETWQSARAHFLRADMLAEVEGCLVVVHWERRQRSRDKTNAERKRRWRERHGEVRTGTQEERVPERVRRQNTENRRQTTETTVGARDDDYHTEELLSSSSSFSDPLLEDYRREITWRFGKVSADVENLLPEMATKGTVDMVVDALAMARSKRKKAQYALGILANWQAEGRGGSGRIDKERG